MCKSSVQTQSALAKVTAVRGHSALNPIPSPSNSAAIPSTHIDMPYLAIVYATCGPNHRGSMFLRTQNSKPRWSGPFCWRVVKFGAWNVVDWPQCASSANERHRKARSRHRGSAVKGRDRDSYSTRFKESALKKDKAAARAHDEGTTKGSEEAPKDSEGTTKACLSLRSHRGGEMFRTCGLRPAAALSCNQGNACDPAIHTYDHKARVVIGGLAGIFEEWHCAPSG